MPIDFELRLIGAAQREPRRLCGGDDARQRLHPRLQRGEEDLPLFEFWIPALDELRAKGQEMARLETEIERIQLQEAPRHEAGTGQQRERQRQLEDDEP